MLVLLIDKVLLKQFVTSKVSPVIPFINSPYQASPSLQWVLKVIVPHLPSQLRTRHRYYDPLRLPISLLGFLHSRYRPPIPVLLLPIRVPLLSGSPLGTAPPLRAWLFSEGQPNTFTKTGLNRISRVPELPL